MSPPASGAGGSFPPDGAPRCAAKLEQAERSAEELFAGYRRWLAGNLRIVPPADPLCPACGYRLMAGGADFCPRCTDELGTGEDRDPVDVFAAARRRRQRVAELRRRLDDAEHGRTA